MPSMSGRMETYRSSKLGRSRLLVWSGSTRAMNSFNQRPSTSKSFLQNITVQERDGALSLRYATTFDSMDFAASFLRTQGKARITRITPKGVSSSIWP